jgi:hypothetical protein
MEHTGDRKAALSRPVVIDALLKSVSETDPAVAESAVGALAMIFTRSVQDERARPDFLRLIKSPRKLTPFGQRRVWPG